MSSLSADERPFDHTPIASSDLPPTPTRDRNISAIAWIEAPDALLRLGAHLGIGPEATAYKRRLGNWLLWRAGPTRGPARYLAIDDADLERSFFFDIRPEAQDEGRGPSGRDHVRFRSWKEDLLGRP